MHRLGAVAFAASLLAATGASAQIDDLGGTIDRIDPDANTITFHDGRIVHYNPLWRVVVNGREMAVIDTPPGTVIAVAPAGAPVRAVVPGTSQPAMAQVTPSVGTIASVDETRRTVTLADGRVVGISEVRVTRDSAVLEPGAQVYVSQNYPSDRPSVTVVPGPTAVVPGAVVTGPRTSAAWPRRDMTGRVAARTPSGTQIVLNDGTTVMVPPSTTLASTGARTLVVDDLRPGENVIVQVQEVIPVAAVNPPYPVAAVTSPYSDEVTYDTVTTPSYRYPGSAKVAWDRVLIIRRVQAP